MGAKGERGGQACDYRFYLQRVFGDPKEFHELRKKVGEALGTKVDYNVLEVQNSDTLRMLAEMSAECGRHMGEDGRMIGFCAIARLRELKDNEGINVLHEEYTTHTCPLSQDTQ